jgi:hypothetical protein
MAYPVGKRGLRWVSLTLLVLSVSILAGSGAVAARHWRKQAPSRERDPTTAATGSPERQASTPVAKPEPPPAATPRVVSPPASSSEPLYGGIEIGSKGIKAVVVRARASGAAGVPFELAAPPLTANPTLVAGLKEKQMFAPDALRDVGQIVANFCERFRTRYQVPAERTYVIASSGLFEPIRNRSDLLAVNRQHLSEAVRAAAGREVVFIEVAQELELTFRGTVAPADVDDALLLDVGSGSSKACCSEGAGARMIPVSMPYGVVSLADEVHLRVRKNGGTFRQELTRLLQENEKLDRLREDIKRHPVLANQKRIYLVGGVVWALATIMCPGERGPLVALSAADLEAFARKLEKASGDSLPEPDLSAVADDKVREEAASEMKNVRKQFQREQLLAGTRLLQTLCAAFGGADKEMLFARNGYLGLVIGYAMHARDARR